jgi:Ca2+-binding EF-hand superfamily protein
MATEKQKRELEEKLLALVAARFGGDRRAAFSYYDADRDERINKDELKGMLVDAGVGNGLTRWAWAKGIIDELDKSGDGTISWDEFAAALD